MVKIILESFYVIAEGIAFLTSFSDGLLLVYKDTIDFCMLIVVFCNFTELVLTVVCMHVCIYV